MGDTFDGEPWLRAGVARPVCRGWPGDRGGLARADSEPAKADAVAMGNEIFNREWMPNDSRGYGGDGLGPVYNDLTLVPGLNMTDVAQSVANGQADEICQRVGNLEIAANGRGATSSVDGRAEVRIAEIRSSLLASNPSLRRGALSVGQFTVARSQRNPTALFGLGLIDAIPDAAIEAVAKRETKRTPETQGRVSRLKDGRIGRLGWKAQTTNHRSAFPIEVGPQSCMRRHLSDG